MNIGVFDSTGNMNNLGDIIGDLEKALAGMSDETQKATLLQLGFSDKSLSSLQALLGTSEAIKTYEKELRSSMGFTENVANKQLETFSSQMKLLESAVIDVAIEIGEELTPYLQELIPVIQKLLPEIGQKLANAVKQVDWARLTENIANFFITFVENIDTITKIAQAIGLLAIGLLTYTTGVGLANTATAIFNSTLRLNPFVALATAIVLATIALQGFHNEQKRNREEATGLQGRQAEINAEFARLKELVDVGIISYRQYRDQINPLIVELARLEGQLGATAGEVNRFNNLTLKTPQFRGQAGDTRIDGNQLAANQKQLFEAMKSTANLPVISEIATSTASSGPSAFEQARKKIQELIKSSQKQLNDAQKTFISAQITARQTYADNILRIEKDFSSRLSGIIQQSQDRLRNAYKSAVETNLAALFDRSEDKSVAGLVKSLSDKLTASRTLLSNSAELASQGFSQTFIEQIVSAGTETGNELAKAILQSTPETKSELRSLFSALEIESSQGMNSLAEEIFKSQGLATQELKNLYANTQGELNSALLEQQSILDKSLMSANDAFVESVQRIKDTIAEQVAEMGNALGGMEKTIDQFIAKLDQLIAKQRQATNAPAISFQPAPSGSGSGATIGFDPMPTPVANRPASSAPVVNINVKTDTAQSNAMVGKAIAKEVNKYTGGGGGLRGVKVIAL
jgi:hypothetical protein